MIVLDSNVWISLLNVDDSQHKRAKRIFKTLKRKIVIPEYVILETATLLAQKVNKEAADEFINNAINNKDIEILPSFGAFFNEIINFYLAGRNGELSFVDYSLLYLSQRMEIITFDKVLKRELKKIL